MFIFSSLASFILCRLTARRVLAASLPRLCWGGRIRLTRTYNRVGAGGFLAGHFRLLVALSGGLLTALTALSLLGTLTRRLSALAGAGLGLMAGGGASNLWERVKNRQVLDYIQLPKLPGKPGRLIYNLADFSILLGGLAALFGL